MALIMRNLGGHKYELAISAGLISVACPVAALPCLTVLIPDCVPLHDIPPPLPFSPLPRVSTASTHGRYVRPLIIPPARMIGIWSSCSLYDYIAQGAIYPSCTQRLDSIWQYSFDIYFTTYYIVSVFCSKHMFHQKSRTEIIFLNFNTLFPEIFFFNIH